MSLHCLVMLRKCNMGHSFFRRSPRYRINHDADLNVTIGGVADTMEPQSADLLDISNGGAKLKTHANVEANQLISIKIGADSAEEMIEVEGKVRWASAPGEGGRQLGCAFTSPIPPEMMHGFAQIGILDRRLHEREAISMTASAKWELQTEATPVQIVDYSAQGGFCLLSPFTARPRSRVELLIEQSGQRTVVRGEERWQCESDGGYQIGCEFITGQDAIRFTEFLANNSGRRVSRSHLKLWLATLKRAPLVTAMTHLGQRRQVRRQLSMTSLMGIILVIGSLAFSQHLRSQPDQPTAIAGGPIHDSALVSSWTESGNTHEELPRKTSATSLQQPDVDHVGSEAHKVEQTKNNSPQSTERETPLAGIENVCQSLSPDGQSQSGHKPLSGLEIFLPQGSLDHVVMTETGNLSEPQFDGLAEVNVFTPDEMVPQQSGDASASNIPTAPDDQGQQRALMSFREGCALYQVGEFREATSLLELAVRTTPDSAKYHYILALAYYQLRNVEQAELSVVAAVKLEQDHPVPNWGRTMEGYQGPARFWLEHARRQAREELNKSVSSPTQLNSPNPNPASERANTRHHTGSLSTSHP